MTFLALFAGECFPLYKTIPLPLEWECMIQLTERIYQVNEMKSFAIPWETR